VIYLTLSPNQSSARISSGRRKMEHCGPGFHELSSEAKDFSVGDFSPSYKIKYSSQPERTYKLYI
jgi:hypothetical protein